MAVVRSNEELNKYAESKAPLTGTGASGTWGISVTGNAGTVTNGVYTTGDQTIDGVKTFSSSPIVPTPTTGTQATNKDYVDSKTTLATANSYDIGVGQTWQNVTASRVAGVTYTNNTGKPIQISIRFKANGTASFIGKITVGGIVLRDGYCYSITQDYQSESTFIVPAAVAYKVDNVLNCIISSWAELR